MKLQVLRYFAAVAEQRSFSKAAEELYVSQPTLSRQIREMERELGCTLIDRSRSELSLTEKGAFLYQRSREIIDLAERTETELRGDADELAGTVTVGSTESNGFEHLADRMKRFSALHPRVQFELHTGYTDDMLDRLDRGLIDVALLISNVDTASLGYVETPQRDRWGLLVPRDHPLACRESGDGRCGAAADEAETGSVTFEQAAAEPLIMPRRAIALGNLANWFGERADRLHVVATYSLLSNAVSLVERGCGVCVCMDGAVGVRGNETCRFLPFEPAHDQGSLIAWKRERIPSSAARAFIESLLD